MLTLLAQEKVTFQAVSLQLAMEVFGNLHLHVVFQLVYYLGASGRESECSLCRVVHLHVSASPIVHLCVCVCVRALCFVQLCFPVY